MAPDAGPPETLFARLLADRDEKTAVRPALQCGTRSWSYEETRRLVVSAARALLACGLERGDRVVLLLPNSPEYVASFLGVTALGAVAVPVDFNAGPERLSFIAGDTAPKLCLRSTDRKLPAGFPVRDHAVVVEPDSAKYRLTPAPGGAAETDELPFPVSGESDAVILYSAGSTGRPKGAILKHGQLLTIARTLVGVVGMAPDHRDLIVSPMTHSGGWQRVTSTLLSGGCVVIPETGLSVPGLLEDIRDLDIHGFHAAPPTLRVLMMTDERRVREATRGLRSVESSGAPLSPVELQRLMDLMPGTEIYYQYGLTECSRAVILNARAHPDKLHTVGLPTNGVEIAIAGEDGRELGPGEPGEILLSAPQITERYWNRPDLDRVAFRGRWLRTGDIGSVDDGGFLTYHGRADDMINCGGLNFFPAEVENELGPVPGVSSYLIAGVPDPQGLLGEVPWAFVVPESPQSWSPKAMIGLARDRLPPHMIPRRVVAMPSMPLTPSGKPSRRRVLELYAAGSATGTSDG